MPVSSVSAYDPASMGQSPQAGVDQLAGQDAYSLGMDKAQYQSNRGRLATSYADVQVPQLQSSLGASGQFYSTAADKAMGQAHTNYMNQQVDLTSAFNRAKMDMKRQEAYAAYGLVL